MTDRSDERTGEQADLAAVPACLLDRQLVPLLARVNAAFRRLKVRAA